MEWWSQPSDPRSWGTLVASFVLSASVTWLSIGYARSRNLLDLPGQRRSHTQPTPRGGGAGIVVATLACFCLPLLLSQQHGAIVGGLATAIPLLLVATVGWIDDHHPLSARFRVLVHFVAALALLLPLVAASLCGFDACGSSGVGQVALLLPALCVAATAIVWSINLHNFMDGINGLLALQSIFVFGVLAALCYRAPTQAMPMLVFASATLGFLPFNFPRARTFMGDVGSGALGLMIAITVGMAILAGAEYSPQRPVVSSGLIACSAFVIDATCNLLSRMLRGKRWYSAHREHLYQWMARSGMSHARVVVWYMGWNLLLVTPVLWWVNREPKTGLDRGAGVAVGAAELVWLVGIYAVGVALWIFGKQWCLHKMKNSRRHASA